MTSKWNKAFIMGIRADPWVDVGIFCNSGEKSEHASVCLHWFSEGAHALGHNQKILQEEHITLTHVMHTTWLDSNNRNKSLFEIAPPMADVTIENMWLEIPIWHAHTALFKLLLPFYTHPVVFYVSRTFWSHLDLCFKIMSRNWDFPWGLHELKKTTYFQISMVHPLLRRATEYILIGFFISYS